MIQLSGPDVAEAGTRTCINVANAGQGLSAVAVVNGKEIRIDVVHDPKEDKATICFIMPKADSGGVTLTVSNATTGGRGTSFSVISL